MSDRYAIIKSGGKQYRVKEGDTINVELLHQEDGGVVEFNDILFLSDNGKPVVGKPIVDGFCVKGEIIEEIKGPKVIAFKFKRRKNYHRKIGHRQRYSHVKIIEIGERHGT